MDLLLALLTACWELLATMAPYLLLGFLVADALSIFVTPAFVQRHLGKPGFRQTVNAAILGIPLPLCSCSVIPVTASLRKQGASPGATVSFLTSTPQTGADSILATWGMLGSVFSFVRVVVAFVSGVIVGWLVSLSGAGETNVEAPVKSCCSKKAAADGRASWRDGLHYGFVTLPRDIGKSLLLGIVLSALITVLIPESFFDEWGGKGLLSMVIVMLVGLPLYVCSTGSIPIAVSLIHLGFTPGAALVFLITGPATNGATFTTMNKLLGRKATLIFLAAVGVLALAAGCLLDLFFSDLTVHLHSGHDHGAEHLSWIHYTASVLLLGLIAGSGFSKLWSVFSAAPSALGSEPDADKGEVHEHKDHQVKCCGGSKSVGVQSDT